MTILEALTQGTERLSKVGLVDPQREAEFLLAELLQASRAELLRRRTAAISEELGIRYEAGLQQREARKPLSYILESAPFLDMTLRVTTDVLIPRPETECLAERIWNELDSCDPGQTILDIGTGSGNLLIALARHPRVSRALGIDISAPALQVAMQNAQSQGLQKDIRWIQSDLLENVPEIGEPIWAVANLPYVRTADLAGLEPELGWEPRLALDGGEDGLALVRRFIGQAAERFPAGSVIALEVGHDQGVPLAETLKHQSIWKEVRVEKDLAGWPRFVRAIKG